MGEAATTKFGFPYIRFDDFRHEFVSRCFAAYAIEVQIVQWAHDHVSAVYSHAEADAAAAKPGRETSHKQRFSTQQVADNSVLKFPPSVRLTCGPVPNTASVRSQVRRFATFRYLSRPLSQFLPRDIRVR